MATFVSILGAFTRYAGAMCLFSGIIPAALVCILIGIGIHFGAEQIAFNAWKKKIQEQGYDNAVRQGDLQTAIKLYNAKPEEKTLKYINSLNPQVASQIRTMVPSKK